MTTTNERAAEVLAALREADSRICRHESTHRGGAIWEICDDCGQQWADDKGGRKPDPWPEMMEAAVDAIRALSAPGEAVVAAMVPACHGLRRKGTAAIIGILPNKIIDRPASSAEYLRDYEEVPLYTQPAAQPEFLRARRRDMNIKPYVGQKVRLNDIGYDELRLSSREAFKQAEKLTIRYVENIGYEDAPIWAIDVDQPLIDMFLLDSRMVEPR